MVLCTGDTNAIYKISDITLEYDAFATSIREADIREMSIPYTKITPIHYQALPKRDIVWKIYVNNLSVRSLRGLLLVFLDKRHNSANKNFIIL